MLNAANICYRLLSMNTFINIKYLLIPFFYPDSRLFTMNIATHDFYL